MGTKNFVQIEINAVFTTTSGKMQFCSGVFDHFNNVHHIPVVYFYVFFFSNSPY
jgi:hypothetical protein